MAPGIVAFPPRRWLALAVLLTAAFMDLLDTTIVNVAIPSIRGSLHTTYAGIQWIVVAYLLAVAVALIAGGRLGDVAGRKRVFLTGVVGFGLMSLACGLAPATPMLVAGRVLQGLSAALMIPQVMATIQISFPAEERHRAVALYSSVAGVAVLCGPLIGGVMLDVLHLQWRSVFLVNVPVSVLVAMATVAIVPESRSPDAGGLDLGGVALIGTALFALVFGVIEGRAMNWPTWLLAAMLAVVPTAVLLVIHEQRREQRGASALLPRRLFEDRAVSAGLVIMLVVFSGVIGFILAFTIFLQLGLGFTPLAAALTTFPSSLGLIIASQASNVLAPRIGSRNLLAAGALTMGAAMAGLAATVAHYGTALTAWDARPVIFAYGLGMGLILPSLASTIIAEVREHHAGAASGALSTSMQVGSAIGVAVIGAILFGALGAHAGASAERVTPLIARQAAKLGVGATLQTRLTSDFRACFVDRSREEDPSLTPQSCRRHPAATLPIPSRHSLRAVFAAATNTGRASEFVAAIQRALSYEAAVFAASFALLLLLPHRRPRHPVGAATDARLELALRPYEAASSTP